MKRTAVINWRISASPPRFVWDRKRREGKRIEEGRKPLPDGECVYPQCVGRTTAAEATQQIHRVCYAFKPSIEIPPFLSASSRGYGSGMGGMAVAWVYE